MPNFDQLEEEVAALVRDESSPFEFRDAYGHLETAGKTITNGELARLRGILSDFRAKVPNLIILKPIKISAKDLADTLMLNTVAQRLARINARNEALASLTGLLLIEVNKGNDDANLLTRITAAVDKGTQTVTQAKALVDQLTATDATTKTRLKALIDTLGNVSSIFNPQQA